VSANDTDLERPDAIRAEVKRAVVSGAAARMREFRARRAAGRMVLKVEVDDVAVPRLMVDAGFLAEHDVDDRKKVQAAVAAYLDEVSA
jgi:hypothetical protein